MPCKRISVSLVHHISDRAFEILSNVRFWCNIPSRKNLFAKFQKGFQLPSGWMFTRVGYMNNRENYKHVHWKRYLKRSNTQYVFYDVTTFWNPFLLIIILKFHSRIHENIIWSLLLKFNLIINLVFWIPRSPRQISSTQNLVFWKLSWRYIAYNCENMKDFTFPVAKKFS